MEILKCWKGFLRQFEFKSNLRDNLNLKGQNGSIFSVIYTRGCVFEHRNNSFSWFVDFLSFTNRSAFKNCSTRFA